jgi:hypothetical protein
MSGIGTFEAVRRGHLSYRQADSRPPRADCGGGAWPVGCEKCIQLGVGPGRRRSGTWRQESARWLVAGQGRAVQQIAIGGSSSLTEAFVQNAN